MDHHLLLAVITGMVCGVLFAAPVGPMGLLAFLKVAEGRVRTAWILGVGSCLGEGVTALMAAIGAGNVKHWLEHVLAHGVLVAWPGLRQLLAITVQPRFAWAALALLLAGLAYAVWLKRHAPYHPEARPTDETWRAFGLSIIATVLHPGNLAVFTVVFIWVTHHSGLQLAAPGVHVGLAGGVVAGALLIWAAALLLVQRYVNRLDLTVWTVRMRYALVVVLGMSAAGAAWEALRSLTGMAG